MLLLHYYHIICYIQIRMYVLTRSCLFLCTAAATAHLVEFKPLGSSRRLADEERAPLPLPVLGSSAHAPSRGLNLAAPSSKRRPSVFAYVPRNQSAALVKASVYWHATLGILVPVAATLLCL